MHESNESSGLDRIPMQLTGQPGVDAYLELMKRMLTRFGFDESGRLEAVEPTSAKARLVVGANRLIRPLRMQLGKLPLPFDPEARALGLDWPRDGETMVGLARLDQIHQALHTLDQEGIPGDVVEAGVWRGGVIIFAAAYLQVTGNPLGRRVWAADSFAGLPAPDDRYPVDSGDEHYTVDFLRVSRRQVERNFRRYNVSTDHVEFLEGWFEDTLPGAPIEDVALLRLDGDMYSSTWQVLQALNHKVKPGGYVVIDDYGHRGARSAVQAFLAEASQDPQIVPIDRSAVYWRTA